MTCYNVFYRRLTEKQSEEVNNIGWGCKVGRAYLNCEPRGEREPTYSKAIEYDIFEKAAFVRDVADKEVLFMRLQNFPTIWYGEPSITCYTAFPRAMSVGDVIYEPATDEWSYVANFGFEPVTDELFIEYLRTKIIGE